MEIRLSCRCSCASVSSRPLQVLSQGTCIPPLQASPKTAEQPQDHKMPNLAYTPSSCGKSQVRHALPDAPLCRLRAMQGLSLEALLTQDPPSYPALGISQIP